MNVRTLVLSILLAVACTVHADAQQTSILYDLSFSLTTQEHGQSRARRLHAALDAWLAERPGGERYELLVANHLDRVELRTPEPVEAGDLSALASRLVPWGTVELLPAIERALPLMRSERLLVVTDGQDVSAVIPTPVPVIPEHVEVHVLTLPTVGPGTIHEVLQSLQTRDGLAVDGESADLRPETAAPGLPVIEYDVEREPVYRGGRTLMAVIFWILVVCAAGAVFLLVRQERAFRRERIFVRHNNRRPPILVLDVRGSDRQEALRLESYPARLGPDYGNLPHEITIRNNGKRFFLETDTPVRINGMERREYELGRGDQFRAGQVRVFVDAVEKVPWKRPPRPEHRPLCAVPAVAAVAALVLFWFTLPVGSSEVQVARAVTDDSGPALPTPMFEPPPAHGYSRDPEALEVTGFRPPAREFAAPAELPEGPLDFLAIHAHPDDEVLYFGSLLPRLRGLGKRGAVLVFTDGESGLDQYPWRPVGGMYPPRRMSGTELARVRRVEAARAIGALGAQYYLRLGLSNAPYGSVFDVESADAVLDRWGGRDRVIDAVVDIIRSLQPRIVVAPDGPGPALEHFEHQAVGLAVREALELLDEDAGSTVEALIIGTDPRQPDGYTGHPARVLMDPWVPAADGRIPRIDQMYALRAHQTQRDATVIGVQARLTLAHDFFLVFADDQNLVNRIFDDSRVE